MAFSNENLTDLLNLGENPSEDIELTYRVGKQLLFDSQKSLTILEEISKDVPFTSNLEILQKLFQATLEVARLAKESGQKAGTDFLKTIEDRLQYISDSKGISNAVSFTLSKIWVDSGLVPPESVAIKLDGLEKIENLSDDEIDEIFPVFDNLFKKLEAVAFDNLHKLYDLTIKNIGTVPAKLRYWFVRRAVSRPVEIYGELGCALLFRLQEHVQPAALDGLRDRLEKGNLSSNTFASLQMIQNWLTDKKLKEGVLQLVRDSKERGYGNVESKCRLKINNIFSSSIDGLGIQSILATITDGTSNYVAMILIQTGHGIKDALVVPCKTDAELRLMSTLFKQELASVEVFKVTEEYMKNALSSALSSGIQGGNTPNPGLVEFARLSGLSDLLINQGNIQHLLEMNPSTMRIEKLSESERDELMESSENLVNDLKMVEYWLECSENIDNLLENYKSASQRKSALWKHVEQRRDHWVMIFARVALLLDNANDDRGDSILASTMAMNEGCDLKKIPLMKKIVDQSFELWCMRSEEAVQDFASVPASKTLN